MPVGQGSAPHSVPNCLSNPCKLGSLLMKRERRLREVTRLTNSGPQSYGGKQSSRSHLLLTGPKNAFWTNMQGARAKLCEIAFDPDGKYTHTFTRKEAAGQLSHATSHIGIRLHSRCGNSSVSLQISQTTRVGGWNSSSWSVGPEFLLLPR